MSIPNQQIGWSQKSKLLSFISKQLEILTQVTGNISICLPQGTLPFFSTIYFGESWQDACAQNYPLFAVGDNTTFCNSTKFISEAFNSVGTGTIFIAYNGNLRQVSVVQGSNIAIYASECTSCLNTTTTTTTTSSLETFLTTELGDVLTTENNNNLII